MVTNNASNEPTAASGTVLQGQGFGTHSAYSTATYPSTATGTGTILRADGTNWSASTNTYPNTATTGDILYASGSNVIGNLADVAVGQVLTSGGVGAIPAYSATPSVTSITLSSGTAFSKYVEGTWTPGIAFGGSATGITYSTQSGKYTQIGNVVFIYAVVVLTSKGSQTGNATLTGLPVTAGSESNEIIPLLDINSITFPSSNQLGFLTVVGSGTTATFGCSSSGGTAAAITNTGFANTSSFALNGFYFTN